MSADRKTILYVRLPGLLARATACARQVDEEMMPVAVAEGKLIRDASLLALSQGVKVGESVLRARRFCPLLLVIPIEQVDARLLSHQLYDALADFSPTVEPIAPDAAFAVLEAKEEKGATEKLRTLFPGLVPLVCTGISKLAARACGEAGLSPGQLAQAPVSALWPSDLTVSAKLLRLGLSTFGAVATLPLSAILYQFGPKIGPLLHRRAQGEDSDPVRPIWPLGTVDQIRRFDLDPIQDATCLDWHLVALARSISDELTELRRFGRVVTLTVETERTPFQTREWHPPWPIQSPAEVATAARRLLSLQPPTCPVTALRLVVAELDVPHAESLSLFEETTAKSRRKLETTKRLLIARYGAKALTTAGKLPVALRDRRRQLSVESLHA